MKNGDVLVGEVKELLTGVLIMKTDYSDKDFAIEWVKVAEIHTKNTYVISHSDNKVVLRNYEGVICRYDEPTNYHPGIPQDEYAEEYNHLVGVAKLIHNDGTHGEGITIEPANLERHKRNKARNNPQ